MLVHGAGSGPWVFEGWSERFPRLAVTAVDLHAGLDVATASMHDYARRVERAAPSRGAIWLCGWSMGGLVALMAAQRVRPSGLVLIEASPPAEVQGGDPSVVTRTGTFDPEKVYGAFPAGTRARPESQRARDQRKRGISVPSVPCRCLVVYGDSFPEDRGRNLAARYGADELHVPGVDHWGLLGEPAVTRLIETWIHEQRSPVRPA